MNIKALMGSVVIGSLTLASAIPITTFQMAVTGKNFSNTHADTYDVSFKEIVTVDGSGFDFRNSGSGGRRLFVIYEKDISGASDLPSEFGVKNSSGDKFAYFYVVKDNIGDKVASVYGFNRNSTHDDIVSLMNKNIIVNVFMSVNFKGMNGAGNLLDFSAQLKPRPPKDNIPLPDKTTDFSGTYKYSDVVKNLDYLMIKRKDFDKFDYSYLYGVPIFNFLYETVMDRNSKIIVEGLNLKPVVMELIISDETKLGNNRTISFSVGDSEFKLASINPAWKDTGLRFSLKHKGNNYSVDLSFSDSSLVYQFFNDFLNVFFGQISYLGNNYNFLRYDSFLNDDFLGFMNYGVSGGKIQITGDDEKGFKDYANNFMFDSIYKILGDFFYSMFYATFDMDSSTKVKVDFSSNSDSGKEKNYYFEMGFLYRSLITFYPKQYLLNGSYEGVNNHILFRSFYFLYDEKKHNGFISGKTNYFISFNVLKMYDNLMFNLPNSASSTDINRFDANFDVQYGINIFTVSFPLLTTITENPKYTFYINDFNVLNSTAFIPDNPDDADSDLIPIPNCSPSILSASGWSCILKQTSVKVLNFLAKTTGLTILLKPMVTISQTVITFFNSAFVVFHAVPALSYLFQFMIGFSLFVIIFRFFV